MNALLCKFYGCTPSQLKREDAEEVELHAVVFQKMLEKNPFGGM